MSECVDEIDKILEVFCDPECVRYDLSKPFNAGGWRIATEGRIIVAVRRDIKPEKGCNFPLNAANFLDDFDFSQCHISLEGVSVEHCAKCDDKRIVAVEECEECGETGDCPDCQGKGWVECYHCGHTCDCEDSGGTGDCQHCDGGKNKEILKDIECPCECNYKRVVLYEDIHMQQDSAEKLLSLKGLKIAKEEIPGPIHFVADNGIHGAFMTMIEQ